MILRVGAGKGVCLRGECVGGSPVAAASGEIVSRLRGEDNSAVKVLQTGILDYRLVSLCEYSSKGTGLYSGCKLYSKWVVE